MITIEEALKHVNQFQFTPQVDFVDLYNANNQVIAQNIIAEDDMPPFHKSAMDGFACRREDFPEILKVVETIPAGKMPQKKIIKGECSKIMTGSPIPENANCVLMKEDVEIIDNDKVKFSKKETKDNICLKGEDYRKGMILIEKGTLLKPPHIAVLAQNGNYMVTVYQPPKVAVISTGSEIVEPQQLKDQAQIRNSNAYQLLSQLKQIQINATYLGIVKDNPEEIKDLIHKHMPFFDLIILTGGVSEGDYDFVPAILKQLGFNNLFERLLIQPGKPCCFAVKDQKACFALSGNPVSSLLQFEFLVKPLLNRMKATEQKDTNIKLTLSNNYKRKNATRFHFFPVKIMDGKAVPIECNGSAHINAFMQADAVGMMEPGMNELKAGESIHVRLL